MQLINYQLPNKCLSLFWTSGFFVHVYVLGLLIHACKTFWSSTSKCSWQHLLVPISWREWIFDLINISKDQYLSCLFFYTPINSFSFPNFLASIHYLFRLHNIIFSFNTISSYWNFPIQESEHKGGRISHALF